MRWVDFKGQLLKPMTERRLTLGLMIRYRRRSLLQIVRKQEEFQKKLNEAVKKSDPKALALAEKYRHYLDCLSWVLHADH